jgi:hypothetical protein
VRLNGYYHFVNLNIRRVDLGLPIRRLQIAQTVRLTPPGIAATAAKLLPVITGDIGHRKAAAVPLILSSS